MTQIMDKLFNTTENITEETATEAVASLSVMIEVASSGPRH